MRPIRPLAARAIALVPIGVAIALLAGAPAAAPQGNDGFEDCGEVEVERTEVRGGCVFEVVDERAEMRMLTMFTSIPFATCGVSYTLHVGSGGELAAQDVSVTSVKGPCADVVTCLDPSSTLEEVRKLPWRGAIRANGDGDLEASLDACFDSCVGRFEGRLDMDLERRERGWRLRAEDAPFGESGFLLDAAWDLVARRSDPEGG